ncbi:MAG: hypothetical protein GY696_15470 [Gammaproteobacteria bacterium]|nr:hypothetical protein [Gammaproteobacteria bacterium]
MPLPFDSVDDLRQCYVSGLERLLNEYEELGAFILVLANAGFDNRIQELLDAPLRKKFSRLHQSLIKQESMGVMLDDAVDDLAVFRQLIEIGFDQLEPACFRQVGPWELQLNPLRGLRPARMSGQSVEGVSAPFDPDGFNFNKPFLRKEIFWEGDLLGRRSSLLYNKFPFIEMHALLVPEPTKGRSQLLNECDHAYLWDLVARLERKLPGVGFGYNSYGAFASVNHLHFQLFVRKKPLPVTRPQWQHNGGYASYPVGCLVFDSPESSWQVIDRLHRNNISYNLLYLPGKLYCFPRRRQGEYQGVAWSGGFAWYELAGGFTLTSKLEFLALNEAKLSALLGNVSLLDG